MIHMQNGSKYLHKHIRWRTATQPLHKFSSIVRGETSFLEIFCPSKQLTVNTAIQAAWVAVAAVHQRAVLCPH